ncbi:ABC transporter permease [uncultured Amnibacterium sp.]|uniref:ABC transporter permease n=1 Tax=uncultured Amnibacterium sp. TaxID=1631851 RepID=UPI0035CC5AC2
MPDTATPRLGRRLPRALRGRDSVIVSALLLVAVVACVAVPNFFSDLTVNFLLIDAVPVLLMAMPLAFIIITGEIDLSIASIAGLSAATMGVLWANLHLPVPLIVLLCALVGVACGALNGFLITVVGLPSLAVTIGTLALFRGLALVVIGDRAVADFPPDLTAFATSTVPGTQFPLFMLLALVVVTVFGIVLHLTPYGRGLFALGYSTEAAGFVGIRVGRAKFGLYVVSGLVCSLVGTFWVLRYSTAQSDSVEGLELTVVAAVLLGGVSIFGGSGGIVGVVAGVLLIRTVTYALQLAGLPDTALTIVTGGLLVVSVVAPTVSARISAALARRRGRRPDVGVATA